MQSAKKPRTRKTEDYTSNHTTFRLRKIIGEIVFGEQVIDQRINAIPFISQELKQVKRVDWTIPCNAGIHHFVVCSVTAKYFLHNVWVVTGIGTATSFCVGIAEKKNSGVEAWRGVRWRVAGAIRGLEFVLADRDSSP